MTLHRTLVLVTAAFTLAACSDRSTTAPVEELGQAADVGKSNTTPSDSARTPPPPPTTPTTPAPPPRDTAITPPPTVASFTLSGKVLGLTRTTASNSADTLRADPIPGIPIRIMRNLLVNGQATQTLAAETTSDANGEYRATGLAGGYYVAYANPAAGSVWASNYVLIAGTTPNVTANIYLGRK